MSVVTRPIRPSCPAVCLPIGAPPRRVITLSKTEARDPSVAQHAIRETRLTTAPAVRRLRLPAPARVAVLVSGSGTLLQALLDHTDSGLARVVLVAADRAGIEGLARAERAGVETVVTRLADHPDRAAWDRTLTESISAARPDLIVLAGFMKLLGPAFLGRFAGRMINTHPALLPAFPGAHPVRDALAYGVKVTGATVAMVDSGVDTGPVLVQEAVPVCDGDIEAVLHERIKVVERRLVVDVVHRLVRDGCTVTGREVSIP
jgi:phosphoribosylglycinamide formyltransferase-1